MKDKYEIIALGIYWMICPSTTNGASLSQHPFTKIEFGDKDRNKVVAGSYKDLG